MLMRKYLSRVLNETAQWINPVEKQKDWQSQELRQRTASVISTDEESYSLYKDEDTQLSRGDVRDFLEMYQTLHWIFVCVKTIADCCAMLPRRVIESISKNEYIIDKKRHPVISLINNPNNILTPFELITKTVSYYCLVGDAYWFLERDNGNIQKIHVPRPDRIECEPTTSDKVSYNRHRPEASSERWDMRNVVRFTSFNPVSDYQGFGAAQASEQAAILECYQLVYGKRYFENAVIPSLIFSVPELLSDASFNRIVATLKRLHQGVDKFFNVALLEGDAKPIEVERVSPQDSNYLEMKEMSREEIFTTMGCYHLVSLLKGENANAVREAYRLFYEITLMPLLKNFTDTVNKELLSQYDINEEVEFEFDLRSAPGLRANVLDESQADYRYWMMGAKTPNYIRNERKFGEDVPWGDSPPPTLGMSRSSFVSPEERNTMESGFAHPERYDAVENLSNDKIDNMTEEEAKKVLKTIKG